MLRSILLAVVVAILVAATNPPSRAEVVIEVAAGKLDRVETPLFCEIDDALKKHRHFTLTRLDTGAQVPVQVSLGEMPRIVWLLQEPLAAGTARQYRLAPATAPIASEGVAVEVGERALKVTSQGKPVLVYNTAMVQSADRGQAYYDRSGYIHPLYNPRGEAVTDDFAPDHPHQHGLMFPWTNTTFEGRAVNFWDQQQGKGKIEHAKIESRQSGAVFGGFSARLNHLDVSTADNPKPVLEETWRVRVYNPADYFLFDFESVQACQGSPLKIEKHFYGGLAIRGHRNWLVPGQGDFLTSENKNRKSGNQTRPRWCDMHGKVDGRSTGITIFCDPGNFRAPQPVRLHPQKPYFCFSPMALGSFAIEAGKPYVSRYRFYVHDGPLDKQTAERLWQDLADPPQVAIRRNGIGVKP